MVTDTILKLKKVIRYYSILFVPVTYLTKEAIAPLKLVPSNHTYLDIIN